MLTLSLRFDREFEPRIFYTNRQRKRSYPTSGESSSGDERVNGKSPPKKRDLSSDEESITDETMYRKKYYFIKKIAKSIIFVSVIVLYCVCILVRCLYRKMQLLLTSCPSSTRESLEPKLRESEYLPSYTVCL